MRLHVSTTPSGTRRAGFASLLVTALLALTASALQAAPPSPSQKGAWAGPYALPDVSIHLALLPDAHVVMYADDDNPDYDLNGTRLAGSTRVFVVTVPTDSVPGFVDEIDNLRTNLFCSGHTLLADGRLLILGGHMGHDGWGAVETNIIDYRNNYAWSTGPNMAAGRWYPTVITLPDGNAVVMAGTKDQAFTVNQIPELWNVADGSFTELSTASSPVMFYPWLHVAPNGLLFDAGPEWSTQYLDYHGTGSWIPVAGHILGNRDYGSSVMYDDGKILVVGGVDPPTNTSETIDLNAATPSWQASGSMKYARRHLNATLLPDGKILVNGGTSSSGFNTSAGQVFAAEMWDPATGLFTTMANATVQRLYHSTALLLPDGRVFTAGSGRPVATDGGGIEEEKAEFFLPPYLFKGARPVMTSAPTVVDYGQTFVVTSPSADSITKVNWIRLSAVTHAFNVNQRINHLAFTHVSGGLNITTPANTALCPPGHYMLFILNANGVPSIAKIIQIVPGGATLAVNQGGPVPARLALRAPWPNPARGAMRFTIELPRDGALNVDVLDVQGRAVRALHRGAAAAGTLSLEWDGADARHQAVPPGLYFLVARSGTEQAQIRFLRIR